MNLFEAPLARIRAARYRDPDTGRAVKFKVAKPASARLRAAVKAWANQKVPRELEDFMAVTAGVTGLATLDLRVGFDEGRAGPTGVWTVYDYGNGDCMGLEEEGDRCLVWWIGHDPWGVILVRDSLLGYVHDFADFAERAMEAEDPGEEDLFKPRVELSPRRAADVPQLKLPPDAVLYDFTGCPPRSHGDLARFPEHARRFETQRLGRYLIAAPRLEATVAPHVAQADAKVEQAIAMATMELFTQADALLDEALAIAPGHARAAEWKALLRQRKAGE